MQEIEQHQRRLATALLRIGAAFERLGEPPPASQVLAGARDLDDLDSEIEIARLTRAVAEAKAEAEALAEQLAGTHATLEEVVLELSAQIESRDAEIAELRSAPAAAAPQEAELPPAAPEEAEDPGAQEELLRALQELQDAADLLSAEVTARDEVIASLRETAAEAGTAAADKAALVADLEASLTEVAALREKLAALSEQHNGSTATLEEVVLALTGQIEARDREIATLRAQASASSSAALTEAAEAAAAEQARLEQLRQDAERHAAELTERLAILTSRHESTTATQEERLRALNDRVEAQAEEMSRMRHVNIQLREALRVLREGLAGGLVEAAAVNRALEAEVAALSSARDFERAELDSLLEALDPLIAAAPVTAAQETADA